jgi:hypothetical protein
MSVSLPDDERLSNLIDSLTSGFEALFEAVRDHNETAKAFKQRLDFAADEVRWSASPFVYLRPVMMRVFRLALDQEPHLRR